jgi:hypothetical protein
MKGPRVKDWVKKTYDEAKMKVDKNANAHDDPALWAWFREAFELEYGNIAERRKAWEALLKLKMSKGDVEKYIERFENLRKSAKWPRDSLGTLWTFQQGLGPTHTHEIQTRTIPHLTSLTEWYAMARNQWKGKGVSNTINHADEQNEAALTRAGLDSEFPRPNKGAESDDARAAGCRTASPAPKPIDTRTEGTPNLEEEQWQQAPNTKEQRNLNDVTQKDKNSDEEAERWQRALETAKKQWNLKVDKISINTREENPSRTRKKARPIENHATEMQIEPLDVACGQLVRRLRERPQELSVTRREEGISKRGRNTNRSHTNAKSHHSSAHTDQDSGIRSDDLDTVQTPGRLEDTLKQEKDRQHTMTQTESRSEKQGTRNSNAESEDKSERKRRKNQLHTKNEGSLTTELEPRPVITNINRTVSTGIIKGRSLLLDISNQGSLGRTTKLKGSPGAVEGGNATSDFVHSQKAEQWGALWKGLPRPQSTGSADEPTSQSDAVDWEGILEALYQRNQQLLHLRIANLNPD